MAIGERIKKLRKALDLTQQEFSDRIGSKRNTVATYEMGRTEPSAAIVSLICREFDVSETWLRTGEGEMFINLPHNDILERDIRSFLQGDNLSFRERLISLLLRLEPNEWEKLEGYLIELASPEKSATARTDKMTDEEAHAELDRQLREEKEQAEKSQVLQESSSSNAKLA